MAFAAGTIVAIAGVIAYSYSQCWHFVLWHHRKPVAIIGVPALLMVGFIGYDLGSPLFTNKTVNEEFPFAFTATVPADMSRQQVEDVMAGIAMVDQTIQEVMPKSMAAPEVTGAPLVPELSSSQQPLTVASPATNETTVATAIPLTTDTPPPAAIATPVPVPSPTLATTLQPAPVQPESGTVKLKAGSFRDQDSFHKESGQETIYRGPDGSHLLRIEDFKVTNGPDLHIFLSPHPNPTNLDELYTFGAVDLGKLKDNIGNQDYPIPEDVDVSIQMTAVIYCVPFHVFFSIASLDDVG
jgi:hypothetical protein